MTRSAVEAVLTAGETETLYRRAGDGPPVLVLCTGALAEPLGGRLFERLATGFRVIAAAAPDGGLGETLRIWLDEMVEGLGLVRPSVVIDAGLAGALLDGALVAPESFAGVVAVTGADATAPARRRARPGVLDLRLGGGADVGAVAADAAARMTPFLAGTIR